MKGVGAHAGCAISGVTGATICVAGGMMGRAELGGATVEALATAVREMLSRRIAECHAARLLLLLCRVMIATSSCVRNHRLTFTFIQALHTNARLCSLTRHTLGVILTRHRISKASPQNQGLLHGRGHRRSQSQGHTRGASSRDVCMHRAPCAGPLLGARGGGSASVHVRPPDAPDACARPRRRRPRRWRRRRQPPLSAARSALETALRGYNAP